jgi:hypothetical protein
MSRRHHDVGGDPTAAGAIVRSGKPDESWQVAFTATLWALIGGDDRRMALDEMRRGVEDMRPEDYDAIPYYDRQTLAVTSAMVERGYLTWEEVEARIEKLSKSRKRDEAPPKQDLSV